MLQIAVLAVIAFCTSGNALFATPRVRIMPANRARWIINQRFDLRVEASAITGKLNAASFQISINGTDVNTLFPGRAVFDPASNAVMLRELSFASPMANAEISATVTDDSGTTIEKVSFEVVDFRGRKLPVQNVIILIGDGMGVAHRTAARIVSKGVTEGKANELLNMDTMPVTGLVMTSSLNALVTDSSPGASAYSTGNKANNNQEGVFPDNTSHAFDNPRQENLAEYLHRFFGKSLGIVTTADVEDATPAAFAVHTSDRTAGTGICDMFFDERVKTGLTVLMGGGAQWFLPDGTPASKRSATTDNPDRVDPKRNLLQDFISDGWTYVKDRDELNTQTAAATKLLGLFQLGHMNVAFDKLKQGDPNVVSQFPRQPMLNEMASAALVVLAKNLSGFVLMIEGASIDKQAHQQDSERWIWDVIEFDKAVGVALDFARRDGNTLVIVTADHETAGVSLHGVGNPALRPRLGIDPSATRDYPQAYRDYPNYMDANGDGYPDNPDPDKKLLVGYGANTDRNEDYLANPTPIEAAVTDNKVVTANPKRDSHGHRVIGQIESGVSGGAGVQPQISAVHTASDIALAAFGPGDFLFTGTQDNTEVFFKIMFALGGKY